MQRLAIRLPDAATVFLSCVVPCGAFHDPRRLPGLAHFTEHMVARNARQLGDACSLEYEAGVRFGSWLDAYTTLTDTCYEIETLPEHYEAARAWLEQVATSLPFSEEDWCREQRVLWLQLRGNERAYSPNRIVRRLVYGARSRYARLPDGTVQSLKRTTPEAIRRFWQRHYQPERMLLLEVGALPEGIAPEALADLDKKHHFLTRDLPAIAPRTGPVVHFTPAARSTLEFEMVFLLTEAFIQQPELLFCALLLYRILDARLMHTLRHEEGMISSAETGMETYPLRLYAGAEAIARDPVGVVERALEAVAACRAPSVEEMLMSARLALRYLLSLPGSAYRFGQHLLTPTGIFWADELQFVRQVIDSPGAYLGLLHEAARCILTREALILLLRGSFSARHRERIRAKVEAFEI